MDCTSEHRGQHEQPALASSAMISVLVVDDIRLSREGLADQLRQDHWVGEVRTAADANAAVLSMRTCLPDVVLLNLASVEGLATLTAIRVVAPKSLLVNGHAAC
jgi:chemotaxis response regulator CheB